MSEAETKTCWCYTTSEAYLLPTLVSASQLKLFSKRSNPGIKILCIGENNDLVVKATDLAYDLGVELLTAPHSAIASLPMTFARFFIGDFISSEYGSIVYLDGDTQIVADVDRLSLADTKVGSILAAPDLMSMTINRPGRFADRLRAYFTSIGLSTEQQSRYFNAGVIKARVNDWNSISRECLEHAQKRSGYADLRFLDQDLLNIVMSGKQTLMSMSWNFPGFFLNKGLDQIVPPRIVHFMSRPRPWNGPFKPWGHAGYRPYTEFIAAYPFLSRLHTPFAKSTYTRYLIQQQFKTLMEPWGSEFMRNQLRLAEAAVIL